jgi:hypothetical protein
MNNSFLRSVLSFCWLVSWIKANSLNSVSQLDFDENGHLTQNYLLYVGSDASCSAPGLIEEQRTPLIMTESLATEFFNGGTDVFGSCAAVCLNRGLHADQVFHPLPSLIGDHVEDLLSFARQSCQRAEVGFISYNPNEAIIFWVNKRNQRKQQGTLKRGERYTVWQETYLGHKFEVVDSVTQQLLLNITVTHDAIYPLGNHVSALQVRTGI